jgi:hypothetical protein
MSQKRNLGPILALTGAGIALAAVIAGFLITGGPGDARDRRLDDMTTSRLHAVASMVGCAFVLNGSAPLDIDAARASIETFIRTHVDPPQCSHFTPGGHFSPELSLPSADYTRLDDTHIRLCADFRRPYTPTPDYQPEFRSLDSIVFPELETSRPAGRHCYDIELTRPPAPLSQ